MHHDSVQYFIAVQSFISFPILADSMSSSFYVGTYDILKNHMLWNTIS